jgi:AcrR family transcriptional regulator
MGYLPVMQMDPARLRVTLRAHEAFLRYGYNALSMSTLAEACGLTRRGLYNHFSNKEDAFRAVLWLENETRLEEGQRAATALLEEGAGALDVVFGLLDVRFGILRRRLNVSPHAKEVNDMAFLLAHEMMINVAGRLNAMMTDILNQLVARGRLRIHANITTEHLASLLTDGARGVSQARPPVPSEQLAQRYRDMSAAILFGCAIVPNGP